MSAHDIFVKVSGGFKIQESSADLGIALALLSSYFQQALPPKSLALAELSLTGALKAVNGIEQYCKEAQKFGITAIYTSADQKGALPQVHKLKNVYQLLELFSAGEQ